MDLGRTIKEAEYGHATVPAQSGPKKKSRKEYPDLHIRGAAMKKFQKEHNLKVGDKIHARVHLEVHGHNEDADGSEYGNSLHFHVHSCDGVEHCDGCDGDEKDEHRSGQLE